MRRAFCAALLVLVTLLVYRQVRHRTGGALQEGGLSVSQALGGSADPGYLRAEKPRYFTFPADHGPHPGFRNEWWYFTGNLTGTDGRRFGYSSPFSPPPSRLMPQKGSLRGVPTTFSWPISRSPTSTGSASISPNVSAVPR